MSVTDREYLSKHKKYRIDTKKLAITFLVFAFVVAVIVFWWLKLTGITVTVDALCGLSEHTHSEECYNDEQMLICTQAEHIHSTECFPDNAADTETEEDWLETFEGVTITNDIAENIIAIATSQVGYTESDKNFEHDADGNKNGYTRYGEWYGNPYGTWNTMFVSFCLHFSNIYNSVELESAGAEAMKFAWMNQGAYARVSEYSPQRGDIVFADTNADGVSDTVSIILSAGEESLLVISGDSNDKVEVKNIQISDGVVGYGLTEMLYFAEDKETAPEEPVTDIEEMAENIAAPLMLYNSTRANITYINDLTSVVRAVSFKTLEGEILGADSSVYLGQTYIISMEFAEKNTGDEWIQFRHDEDHHLHYQIPANIHCDPFTEWQPITAKTENGTIENVGEYFIREDGLLIVVFHDDPVTGECFGAKYSNVDFIIEFSVTVGKTEVEGEDSEEIDFTDEIKVTIDGGAGMDVTKTHGEYNGDDNTIEYTIRVEATHGVVSDLVIDDQIWDKHYALRDTIVVTDLDGNVLDPQPVVSNHPYHDQGAQGGFRISGFPDFAAGDGYLIKYKSSIYDAYLGGESVSLWNGIDANGNDSNGNNIYRWAEDWDEFELEKMAKDGKQSVIEDADGNLISVIEWGVGIRKHNSDLHGTVVIDTLGEGLEYYTQEPIYVVRYDEWGYRLPDVYIDWSQVTITENSMSFELPSGFAFDIVYYTTYNPPAEGEQKEFSNSVSATINGKHEQVGGTADVIGFVPYLTKSASGDDGEYIYFTIEADVPAIINGWGNFYITDMAAFWGYNGNDVGYLYVENMPEDMVITAVTESGKTVTFTPYVQGGPIENTYMLISPANGDEYHSFNILFNTPNTAFSSSKWMLDEDAKLTITYKIPFDAATGTEWEGILTGEKTVEDVLLEGFSLANEAYLNYTEVIRGEDVAMYQYSPKILKNGELHADATIDYTVEFRNTVPGSYGNDGYLKGNVMAYFTDTFDNRLEYVDGTLTVTCYDPWRPDLWLAKYTYTGTVTGNSINVSADQFMLSEVNPAAADASWSVNWLSTFSTYNVFYANIAGGNHIFNYTLEVKDEYKHSKEYSKYVLKNTAELLWGADGTSGPATEKTEYKTGLVDKQVVQENNKLNFSIHINEYCLDILDGLDMITFEDTMTENLSVYWDTIKLYYEDENGNWIDFDSTNKYNYTVTYDQLTNTLKFVVPDELHIKIDYTTLITQSGLVSVSNSVVITGSAHVSDVVDATFKVQDHSGGATGSMHNITLLKQDGLTKAPLPSATFLLYGPMGDPDAVLPDGASETVVAKGGKTLRYIGKYTTGDDGTVNIATQYLTMGGPYALVEMVAPAGYELLTEPTYFYFYEEDPDGVIQSVTTLIAVENFNDSFLFPETGGNGTVSLTIIGLTLMVAPLLYSILRFKRERRFARRSP